MLDTGDHEQMNIIQHFVSTPAWEMERNIGHEHWVSSMSMWGPCHDPPWAQMWELETFKTSKSSQSYQAIKLRGIESAIDDLLISL